MLSTEGQTPKLQLSMQMPPKILLPDAKSRYNAMGDEAKAYLGGPAVERKANLGGGTRVRVFIRR